MLMTVTVRGVEYQVRIEISTELVAVCGPSMRAIKRAIETGKRATALGGGLKVSEFWKKEKGTQ